MNRKYTREDYLALIRKLREAVPEITISTDIIVGFPNETEEQFQEKIVESWYSQKSMDFVYSLKTWSYRPI